MKRLLIFLFSIISLSAFAQSGGTTTKYVWFKNVPDSTVIISCCSNDGTVYYNQQSDKFRAYVNGAWTDFMSGSGGAANVGELENVTQSGTTYTVTDADAGKMVHLSNVGSITVTLPASLTADRIFNFTRDEGAGVVTFVGSGGAILSAAATTLEVPSVDAPVACSWNKTNSTNYDGFGQLGTSPGGGGDITIGTTAISGGTNARVLYDNSGAVGEYSVSGTGNVAMTTSPVFTTPNIGTATGSVSGNAGTATTLATPRTIGTITGDATSAGSSFDGSANNTNALTLATVNSNVGTFGSATQSNTITVNGKGLITAIAAQTVTPAIGSITGLGTGIATALAINTGSAGAPVLFNGAGGTPSSINLSNANSYPAATESTSGISEVATQAETDGFTDDVRQVTPLKLHTNLKRRSTKTANFSISSSDAGATLDANGSSTITCTVDAMSTGDQVFITNRGTANVSFAAGSGVSISGLSSLKPGFAAVIDYNASGSATIYGGDVSASGVTVLYKNTNSVSNSGSTETDLYSYTMSAGTLSTDGESLEGVVAGTFAATANNKRIRLKIGTTTVFDSGSLAITSATDWSLTYNLIRVSDASQKCVGTLTLSNTTTQSFTDYATAAETLSVSNIIKVTGQGTSSSDLTSEFTKIKKIGY